MDLGYIANEGTLFITLKHDEIDRFLMVCQFLVEDERVKTIILVPPPEFFKKIKAPQGEKTEVEFPVKYLNFGATVLGQLSVAMSSEGIDNSEIEQFLEKVGQLCATHEILH